MAVIGSVEVEVVPSAKGFVSRIRAEILPGAAKAGEDAGEKFGDKFATTALPRIKAALKAATSGDLHVGVDVDTAKAREKLGGLGAGGRTTGAKFGDEFGRSVNTRLTAAIEALPEVDLKTGKATTQIEKLRRKLELLAPTGESVAITVDDERAIEGIESVRFDLERLAKKSPDIRVRVNAKAALVEIAALRKELGLVEDNASSAGESAGDLGSKIGLIGPVAVGAFALLGPLSGAATAALVGAGGAAATALLAFKGIKSELDAGASETKPLQGQIDSLGKSFDNLEAVAAQKALPGITDGLAKINKVLPSTSGFVAQMSSDLGSASSHLGGAFANGLKNSGPLFSTFGTLTDRAAASLERFTASDDYKRFINYSAQELPKVANLLENLGKTAIEVGRALQPLGDYTIKITTVGLDGVDKALATVRKFHLSGVNGVALLSPGKAIGDAVNSIFGKGGESKQDKEHAATARLNAELAKQAGLLHTTVPELTSATGALSDHAAKVAEDATQTRLQNALLTQQNPVLAQSASLYGTTALSLQTANDAQDANAASIAQATVNMQRQNDAAGLLQQALDKLNNNQLGVAESNTRAAQAVNSATDSFKQNGAAIVGTSKAALDNQTALQGSVRAALDVYNATAKQTGSTVQASTAFYGQRDALLAALRAQGTLTPQVQAYVDTIFKIPPAAKTQIDLQAAQAFATLTTLTGQLNGLAGRTVQAYINVGYQYSGADPAATAAALSSRSAGGKNSAWGNIFKSYSNGGVEKHVAQIAQPKSNTVRIWAEPETKGESYIPHANDGRRPRAHSIMAQTAQVLGGNYTPYAQGGIRGYTPSAPSAGSRQNSLAGLTVTIDAGSVGTLTGHIVSVSEEVVGSALGAVGNSYLYGN